MSIIKYLNAEMILNKVQSVVMEIMYWELFIKKNFMVLKIFTDLCISHAFYLERKKFMWGQDCIGSTKNTMCQKLNHYFIS